MKSIQKTSRIQTHNPHPQIDRKSKGNTGKNNANRYEIDTTV